MEMHATNIMREIKILRKELEKKAHLKGLRHCEVLKLSQRMDNLIMEYYKTKNI